MEQSPAPRRLSYNLALYILVASTLVAYLSTRISLSPSTLVLLSPLLLVGGVLGWIAIDLYVTWWVEQLVKRRLQQLSGNSGSEGGSGGGWRSAGRTHRGVPPLSFTSSAAWSVTLTRASWEAHTTAFRFHFPSAPPALSSALDHLFDLIMRDFVLKWFTAISDSPTFPNAVEQTIRESIATLATRVGEVDWSDVIVGRILPLVTEHVDSFRAAEVALRGQDLRTQLTESDELDLFLASSYASETKTGRLHASVDVASPNSRPAEEAWLRGVVGRLLPLIMPAREVESGAVRIMAREIVSCAVLLPIIELLSDPDFWNRIIDEKVSPSSGFLRLVADSFLSGRRCHS
jgi:sorting nexin-25